MKKILWVVGIALLALALVIAGCAKPAAPTTPPATTTPAAPPKVAEGPLTAVSPEKSTITVTTPQGPQTFTIGPQTALTLQGQTCTLEQLAELEASGGDFDCTVVYDEFGEVAAVNVYRITPKAESFRGTISDVNVKESTVTVKTAEGDKVFDVDPTTGLLVGGVACSLELLNALVKANEEMPSAEPLECTVIASTDEEGKAVYIDIASPPKLTIGTGTVEKVDIQKSTVTIQTDKGERTFEVDAETGSFLDGKVCSLQDILDATEHGATLTTCEVMFFTNEAGDLVYLDVTHQTNP
ncbi:MAG: hypothetical protein HYX80_00050 [Chloroflexi bacterium]|nr:hypothetical protein [Chloroflexota bacterium]